MIKESNIEIQSKNHQNKYLDNIEQEAILKSFLNFDINQHHSESQHNKAITSSKHLSINTLNKRNKSEHQSLESFESIHRNSSNSCSNLHRKVSVMSNAHASPRGEGSTRRRNTLFKNPVVQMIKHLTNTDELSSNKKGSFTAPGTPFSPRSSSNGRVMIKQTEQMKQKVLRDYNSVDVYKAIEKYSGFGITNDLSLEVDDIVGVLKKSDPCGNPLNWFVDNGSVKGIVSSSILSHYKSGQSSLDNKIVITSDTKSKMTDEYFMSDGSAQSLAMSFKEAASKSSGNEWSDHFKANQNNKNIVSSSSEDEFETNNLHNYVNSESFNKDVEVSKASNQKY